MSIESLQIRNFIDGVEPTMGKLDLQVADSGARDIDLAIIAAETVSRFSKGLSKDYCGIQFEAHAWDAVWAYAAG